jgi:hypothetical protein
MIPNQVLNLTSECDSESFGCTPKKGGPLGRRYLLGNLTSREPIATVFLHSVDSRPAARPISLLEAPGSGTTGGTVAEKNYPVVTFVLNSTQNPGNFNCLIVQG